MNVFRINMPDGEIVRPGFTDKVPEMRIGETICFDRTTTIYRVTDVRHVLKRNAHGTEDTAYQHYDVFVEIANENNTSIEGH